MDKKRCFKVKKTKESKAVSSFYISSNHAKIPPWYRISDNILYVLTHTGVVLPLVFKSHFLLYSNVLYFFENMFFVKLRNTFFNHVFL